MRILIADDETISRSMLEDLVGDWGHDVVGVADGAAAWQALQSADAPKLAILDWQMPEMDGVEVCRRARSLGGSEPAYILLLTVRQEKANIVAGLQAGANDYLTKPFDPEELRARLNVGIQVVTLQQALAERIRELEGALADVKRLRGILPICSYCKKIRNDNNYWQQVDSYMTEHSEALFSHGICPDCLEKAMKAAREEMGLS